MDQVYVRLEFKRIQTYLFASPRLRAMLGANTSLGRVIRVHLPELAKVCGAKADVATLAALPEGDPSDPLVSAAHSFVKAVGLDDPQQLYRDYGVLVRDGGHFTATFPSTEQAQSFIQRAIAFIMEDLPGILVEASINDKKVTGKTSESLFQHPAFQVSHQLGNRPASARNNRGTFVSSDEGQMEEIGRRFREDPQDLIGMLEGCRLIPCTDTPPENLSEIAREDGQRGYIALIHADGNGIGQRYQTWRKKADNGLSVGKAEAHGEHFFHSMRVAVRRALQKALKKTFDTVPRAYQLLMLGGDDLLLVCSASRALTFVEAYAKALQDFPLVDGEPLTVGVGVAITKDSFPFHRLHAVAEALADSAKQRYRADPSIGSVVDWHITTNSWVEDPIAERRQESLTGQFILSSKPYPILGNSSLDALLVATNNLLEDKTVARSQLRKLTEEMRYGQTQAELAWEELPEKMRTTLCEVVPSKPLFEERSGCKISCLPDLVELYELLRSPSESKA